MTHATTAAAVAARLSRIAPDPIAESDLEHLTAHAEMLSRDGWTADEIVAYLRNMEEVDASLNEDTALHRMIMLRDQTEHRIHFQKFGVAAPR